MNIQKLYDQCDQCKPYNYMDKYNLDIIKFREIIEKIKTFPEYDYIKKYIDPNNNNCIYVLFSILNKKKLCHLIGCQDSKYHNMLIPKDDLIYLLLNRKDSKKVFNYFHIRFTNLK